MTSAIVALLYVTGVAVLAVWLGVLEDRVEAKRAAEAEERKHFNEWETEVKAS